jgi:PleD family two-component response regulator
MDKNKKVILIVEDDKPAENALKQKLEKEGLSVLVASNGLECIKILDENTPNLVLLDILMPIMDGIETIKKMKENERTKNIPVVLLTNSNSNEKISEALDNDTYEYLIKSDHTLESIVEYVKNKLG